ncbi:hypothetical protein ABE504_13155 [Paenibacillus oryzisoli]|uniref:CHASE3 domain-containing protein n=1 Tax=Paenibacillus oryzisoli TaxID=1850517 RepID=UPI003D2E5B0D
MKMRTKILGTAVISSLLLGAVSASAYSKSYTFEVHASLYGTTVFSLQNLSTNTQVSADTYQASYALNSTKSQYQITLYKSYLQQYPQYSTANGTTSTLGFGVVPAGDYTLNITKSGAEGFYVIGSGSVNQ